MTSHLANAVRAFLERQDITAIEIERRGVLKPTTIATILRGRHPRPDTMGTFLRAVLVIAPHECEALLRAYLIDDCPREWEPRLTIALDGLPILGSPLPAGYDRLTDALDAFRLAAIGDPALSAWLIESATLLRLMPPEITTERRPVRYTSSPGSQTLKVAEDPRPEK